jgi:hypothetical protein
MQNRLFCLKKKVSAHEKERGRVCERKRIRREREDEWETVRESKRGRGRVGEGGREYVGERVGEGGRE